MQGKETPTTLLLAGRGDLVAVHVTAFWEIMEALKSLSCHSILVMTSEKMMN